ncbi:LuxR family transcriptional regulator [Pseudolysobacter antarcticus]|uniref:LuxR family transcriptional regulator n=2 Tax=Pseudolysobacter antarcticus TaxID=2511995 RepID=A0A411HPZ9_9GAMM|nr:LuxR family transcriptional regulator [Pseudolysobacter antarcticus]
MRDSTTDDIYALWDELAGFPISQADDALNHMLSRLCSLFDAKNALWSVVVRLPTPAEGDLLNGWRPRLVRLLHPLPSLATSIQAQVDKLWLPEVDISAIIGAAGDEPFLTRLLSEALPRDWFEGEHYRRHYLDVGHADHLSARCAINEDVRIHLFLYRGLTDPRFTADTKAPFTLAIRGLRWLQHQIVLSHGIHAASAPLTPTERSVLLALLGGETETQIARSSSKSFNTIHAHIKSIYSKFGVHNRPALTALWLSQGASVIKPKPPAA